jgi:hypothetical protein
MAVGFFIDRFTIGLLRRNLLTAEEFEDSLIHGLHALATPRLNQRGNLIRFAFPNHRGHGCCPDQNLDGKHPPLALRPYQQLLGNDPFERVCQHDTDLTLLVSREDINEAVDR